MSAWSTALMASTVGMKRAVLPVAVATRPRSMASSSSTCPFSSSPYMDPSTLAHASLAPSGLGALASSSTSRASTASSALPSSCAAFARRCPMRLYSVCAAARICCLARATAAVSLSSMRGPPSTALARLIPGVCIPRDLSSRSRPSVCPSRKVCAAVRSRARRACLGAVWMAWASSSSVVASLRRPAGTSCHLSNCLSWSATASGSLCSTA